MANITFSSAGIHLPPTTMRDSLELARLCGVGRVLVKMESERPLGSFKVLGGMYAGLHALAAQCGSTIEHLTGGRTPVRTMARLLCASDGNHGLAVAAAAAAAGAPATIYLHHEVDVRRADRILETGAEVKWVTGTYDDAVDAARAAAAAGEGLLIPDTSDDPHDPVVRLVMEGYATLGREVADQLDELTAGCTHMFIQAGVGGLAAAMAEAPIAIPSGRPRIIVVEPENAACVGDALRSGRIVRTPGSLETCAEMLSCGEASAPAMQILRQHDVRAMTIAETALARAAELMEDALGVATTPSGAAGLAGLLQAMATPDLVQNMLLTPESVVLLIMTEAGPA